MTIHTPVTTSVGSRPRTQFHVVSVREPCQCLARNPVILCDCGESVASRDIQVEERLAG